MMKLRYNSVQHPTSARVAFGTWIAFVVARARSAAPVSFGHVCDAERKLDVVTSPREGGDS